MGVVFTHAAGPACKPITERQAAHGKIASRQTDDGCGDSCKHYGHCLCACGRLLLRFQKNGKAITTVKEIEISGSEDGYVVLKVGSGKYSFEVKQ